MRPLLGRPATRIVIVISILGAMGGGTYLTVSRSSSPPARAQTEGQKAPEIQAKQWLNTKAPMRLAQLRGRVVLLLFWRFKCPVCKVALTEIGKWERKFGPRGLTILTVHSPPSDSSEESDPKQLQQFVKKNAIRFPVAVDKAQQTLRAYRIQEVPAFLLLDREGKIDEYLSGLRPGTTLALEQRLKLLLGGD